VDLVKQGELETGDRLLAALSAGLRAVRDDLYSGARDPLPRMSGPRWLARLPHVLIVLLAAYLFVIGNVALQNGYQIANNLAVPVAGVEAGALVLAMFRPLPAWWAVTIASFIGARAGVFHNIAGEMFPWTGAEIAVQASVLFLVALRVRPRIAVQALVLSLLVGVLGALFVAQGQASDMGMAILAFGIAVLVGTSLRGRRVANTQLVVQAEITSEERARRTLLEERGRIARELHDVVAHHMSVISIQAQVAPHLVENPPDELLENLAGIRANALEALTELRRVLGVLRSEETASEAARHAPQPTLARLDELVGNVRGAGLTVETELVGEPRPLSPGVELSAFRIVQEALSNAMRHAPGASVHVALRYEAAGLTVRVTNTAPDQPAPVPQGAGHGLLGMRERTAMLGGELLAGATREGGFEVVAIMPTETAALSAPPDPLTAVTAVAAAPSPASVEDHA
jgi:signal transduction histidine kinase